MNRPSVQALRRNAISATLLKVLGVAAASVLWVAPHSANAEDAYRQVWGGRYGYNDQSPEANIITSSRGEAMSFIERLMFAKMRAVYDRCSPSRITFEKEIDRTPDSGLIYYGVPAWTIEYLDGADCSRWNTASTAGELFSYLVAFDPGPVEETSCAVSNPVLPGTGRKLHEEVDYAGAGTAPLSIRRLYRSFWTDGGATAGMAPVEAWSAGWKLSIHASLTPVSGGAIRAFRPDGSTAEFGTSAAANTWTARAGADTLIATVDSTGLKTGYVYRDASTDATETYDANGRLLSTRQRNGWTTTLAYNAAGQVIAMRNQFGREVRLTYDAQGRLVELLPPGAVPGMGAGTAASPIRYAYAEAASLGAGTTPQNQLTSVTWQDGRIKRYHYEDARFPGALTGITDEAGVRYATYTYDAQGRVSRSEHIGGADRVDFAYGFDAAGQQTTQVTDYAGANGSATTRTYAFTTAQGLLRPTAVTAPCPLCGNTQASTTYNAAGKTTKTIAHDGSVTFYAYDAKGRETERAVFPSSYQGATTRPALSAATSVTSTQWHATWKLPLKLAEPGKLSSYTYDSKGNLTGQSWSATSDSTGRLKFSATKTGSTYATGWGYNANSLVTSIVEKTDATETGRWTLGYNALGDVTSVSDVKEAQSVALTVNAAGLATQLVASNGAQAQFTWTPRGLLSTAAMPGYTMGVTWDARALPLQYQFSPGPKVVVTYDALGQPLTVQNGTAPPQTVVWADPEASSTQRYAGVFSGAGPKDRTASLLGPRLEELVLALGRAAQTLELPMSSAQAQVPPAPAFSPGVAYGLSRFIFPNYWAFGPAASNGQFDPDRPSCCGGSSGGPSSSFQSQLPPSFLLTALLIQSTASSVAETINNQILILRSNHKLVANLCKAGVTKPTTGCYVAHHIVGVAVLKFPVVAQSQAILKKFGMDIDDANNGMWLDCSKHQVLHKQTYHDAVFLAIQNASSYADLSLRLRLIALALSANGTYP